LLRHPPLIAVGTSACAARPRGRASSDRDLHHLVTAGCRSSPGRSEPASSAGLRGIGCFRSDFAALEPLSCARCRPSAVRRGEPCGSLAPCRGMPRRRAVAEATVGLRDLANRLLRPSIDTLSGVHSAASRLPVLRFGSGLPASTSRSVLVVSHHLDGLLRFESRGFVAPRCQSWDSSRFPSHRPPFLPAFWADGTGLDGSEDPRDAVHTPRRSPLDRSRTASPQPLPPRRFHDLEALLRNRAPHLRPTIAGLPR
jgi:hypothetical protein